ncbi:ATP-binding protein [Actinomadura meridiana]|uniref:ATP-binding protein n=1 Tax=Actinomadura meridiana TaxID=559626 RepID=A0ABP8CCJ1_9ACTN
MIEFKPDPVKVKVARDHVARIAAEWPIESDDVGLVTSELVSNAVRHAGTDTIQVDAFADADEHEGVYVVEVWDADLRRPVLCRPSAEALGGRGLWVVAQVADGWGVRYDHDDGGKVVYAEWTR